MNSLMNESAVRKYVLLTLMMVVPAFAWAQHKTSSAPKAPAPHASAPAHTSAPSHSSAPTQHTNTPSHTTPTNHTATTNHTMTNTGHGTTSTTGHGTTGTAGHGNTSTTSHGNMSTTHGSSATAGHGNTTGGHGNTMAGHGNTMAGHGNTTAGHGNAAGAHAGMSHTPPGHSVSLKGGGSAHIRPNGQIRSVNRNGMHIDRGLHGERRVVSNRNGVRVVSVGRRGGYVQRAYVVRGGRSYYSRTYYYHGAYRTGVYRGYYWGGRPYYGYYAPYYYRPAYYGWAYNPWPAPVYYGWGWGGAPWYGYYGAYYEPYPVYPSAAFWLTDYLLAASLQAAFEAQAAANAGIPRFAPDGTLVASLTPMGAAGAETAKLSPDVKKALSEEVKTLLATEQAEAAKGKSSSGGQAAPSNEAPPAVDPNFRTFVVSSDETLVVDGEECALSDGDVISRTTDTADDDGNVNVKVVASKKGDCGLGKEGPIAVDDLQEMYNHFREQLKDGMGELAKKQGTGGLPKAPDTSTVDGDVPAPPPDKSAEKAIQDQQADADKTESEVKQEAASGSGGGGK